MNNAKEQLLAAEIFLSLIDRIGDTKSDEEWAVEKIKELSGYGDEYIGRDADGNAFLCFGKRETTSTAFTSHLDTIYHSESRVPMVGRDITGREWAYTLGNTLGADCRAGMALMIYLIRAKVPGLYCFFSGEEKGRIGSSGAAKRASDLGTLAGVQVARIKRMISFDRRGYTSVITKQSSEVTASDEFANKLAEQLGAWYAPDPTGSFTDSYSFRGLIPECTNISVGYAEAHSSKEKQDLTYLNELAETLVGISWDDLPTVRTPKIESRAIGGKTVYSGYGAYDGMGSFGFGGFNGEGKRLAKVEDKVFGEDDKGSKKRKKRRRKPVKSDIVISDTPLYVQTLVEKLRYGQITVDSLPETTQDDIMEAILAYGIQNAEEFIRVLSEAGLLHKLV